MLRGAKGIATLPFGQRGTSKRINMALFNFSKIEGNNNDVQQDIKHGDGCSMKLWQIIVGIATIIGAIAAVVAIFVNK